ncbi:hypothetical protein QQ045_030848 [Rhodiola kirilowii]
MKQGTVDGSCGAHQDEEPRRGSKVADIEKEMIQLRYTFFGWPLNPQQLWRKWCNYVFPNLCAACRRGGCGFKDSRWQPHPGLEERQLVSYCLINSSCLGHHCISFRPCLQGDQCQRIHGMEAEGDGSIYHHLGVHSAALFVDAARWDVQQQVWTRIQRRRIWRNWNGPNAQDWHQPCGAADIKSANFF